MEKNIEDLKRKTYFTLEKEGKFYEKGKYNKNKHKYECWEWLSTENPIYLKKGTKIYEIL